jgi:hypothetical protein
MSSAGGNDRTFTVTTLDGVHAELWSIAGCLGYASAD